MAIIGTVVTKYVLDTTQLEKASKTATSAVTSSSNKIAEKTKMSTMALKAMGAAAVIAAGALVTSLVSANLKSIDSLAKTADKIGITTEKLQAMQFAAELSGGSTNMMSEALVKASKRLGEAADGGGAAAKTIEKLGLNIAELQSLSPDQLFDAYSESIRGLNNRGEQLAAISSLMGDESRNLIGVVDAGSDVFDKAAKNIDDYGGALSRTDAGKVEAANDAMARVDKAMDIITQRVTVALAPAIEFVADLFTFMAAKAKPTFQFISDSISTILGVFDKFYGFIFTKVLEMEQIYLTAFLSVSDIINSFINGAINGFKIMSTAILEVAEKLPFIGDKASEAKAAIQEMGDVDISGSLNSELGRTQELIDQIAEGGGNISSIFSDPVDDQIVPTLKNIKQAATETGDSIDMSIKTNFDNLTNSLKSEEQLATESYAARLQTVTDYYASLGDLNETQIAEQNAVKEQLEIDHGMNMFNINKDKNDQVLIDNERLLFQQEEIRDQQIRGASQLSREIVAITKGQTGALGALGKVAAITATTSSGISAGIAALAPPPVGLGPVFGPAVATAVGIKTALAVGKISGLQKGGGISPNQLALVGENGPELLQMGSRGGFVNTASSTDRILNNNNSKVVNFNTTVQFDITAYDAADTQDWINKNKDTIANAVSDSLRENLREI